MQNSAWWQHAIIYEIYPRSFQDSNGDGIGDLNGIIERLDYLVELGVDAIWISPIYPSPMADFGYDVADYCNIDPIFGSLADFDRLLEETHRRGLKLILDFVPNHTSDQHPWFLESRSSRMNAKRDWYIWRDEPNNWLSNFGGSAWEFDVTTNQYYYHSFLKEQPDLNWRNEAVRTAMFDVLRFWLKRGVDGFRVDVMWLMIKDGQFRDNPPNPSYRPDQPLSNSLLPLYNADCPEVQELVAAMRKVIDEFSDRVLIGEIYLPVQRLMAYYGKDLEGANLPFNFQLLQCAWRAEELSRIIRSYQGALPLGAWPNWVLGNHDNRRIASRIGNRQALVAAMLLFTLPGTLTIYYGEEIGMVDLAIPADAIKDPAEKNQPGLGLGRDPERTPMLWDSSPTAGFTDGQPWLPIDPEKKNRNVDAQKRDQRSIYNLYRELIALRRDHPVLVHGRIEGVRAENNVLLFKRFDNKERILVLLNMGNAPAQMDQAPGTILLSTNHDLAGTRFKSYLNSSEGSIVALDQ